MIDTNIAQLEQKLELLKQKYKSETIFDAEKLKALQINNRGFVRPIQEFKQPGLGLLINDLQKLFDQGWSYNLNSASGKNAYNWFYVYLTKPTATLEEEYQASDAKTEHQYRESLQGDQRQLIEEIAAIKIEIQDLVEKQKTQAKKQRDFAKAIEQVKDELLAPEQSTKEEVQ